jgi:ribokinase
MASPKKKPQVDLLCIGDSCVDVFTFPDRVKINCQLHGGGEKCELCMAFADKIPTKGFDLTFGGNAANVSVGTSRLGIKTAVYTHVGDDAFGKAILDNLKQEKVSVSLVRIDKKKKSNVNLVLSAQGERTILTSHEGRDYRLPNVSPKWIYFSSLAANHAGFQAAVPKFVRKLGAKLVFNPGSYQIKEGRKALAPILEVCEALILNRDEAGQLLGVECVTKGEDECLRRLRNLGPRLVIVTDGPRGSYGLSKEGELVFQKIYPLGVVERTGAGDAFSSGFTAALINGKDLRGALRWGTANAAFVTQKVGAQTGLLKKSELAKVLKGWK